MKITQDTTIMQAVELNENAPAILTAFGMHCLGCAMAHGETVGEAAEVHGIDLNAMLTALNQGLED